MLKLKISKFIIDNIKRSILFQKEKDEISDYFFLSKNQTNQKIIGNL